MARSKVLSLFKTKDYTELFPNIQIIGKPFDFFLECTSYDVILPVKVNNASRLDIFEEAVLKLIACRITTVEKIADILCLTPDLINFIIIRLIEVELLEENGKKLTAQAEKYIKIAEKNTDKKDIEYAQAKVFILNKTGEILPYVQKGELVLDSIYDIQGQFLTLEYGTVGDPIKIKGKILLQNKSDKKNRMLQSRTISAAINRYNRIVRENPRYDMIKYAKDWAMENTSSDNFYFHMKAVVQKGNVDEILISDGLVVNIDFVNKYIKDNYPEFILKVKEVSTKKIIGNDVNTEDGSEYVSGNKYRELGILLSKINKYAPLHEENDGQNEISASQDENQVMQADQKRFLLNCYSAFEWSLFYYDTKYRMSENIESIIRNQTSDQNETTLMLMAEKIGVKNPEKYKRLFHCFDSFKVERMYKSNTPELRVALSIAIVTAVYNDESEFRKLLRKRPGLLEILYDLFKEHGDLSHKTFTYDVDNVRNKNIYDLLIDFISILQPDNMFDLKYVRSTETAEKNSQISQERLNAEVSLSKRMGVLYYYNLLPETIREEWILVSPDKKVFPESAEYFDILYRIMQDTLYYAIKDIRKNQKLSKDEILSKLQDNGVVSIALDTVNEVYIKKILMNGNSTLGANAMVYLYYQNNDKLKKLKEEQFVDIIDQLVKLRKHGNNVSLNVNTDLLNEIRDKMLNIVQLIGGN